MCAVPWGVWRVPPVAAAWGLPPARVRVLCVPPCAMVAALNAVTRSRGCVAPLQTRTRLPAATGNLSCQSTTREAMGAHGLGLQGGLATIAGV